MNDDHIAKGIAPFAAELVNIRYFFRQPRTTQQWQDWLWRRMPKLKAVTHPIPPRALNLGRWGAHKGFDRAVLYSDLLTCLVKIGEITKRGGVYQLTSAIAPLDNAAAPSYTVSDPF